MSAMRKLRLLTATAPDARWRIGYVMQARADDPRDINLQLFGIERIHQHYEKELFAVLDSTLHFEDFGVRLYYKLLTMFGDRRFRGTAPKECLIGADFQEWEKTRKAFLEYVLESEGKNDARWELAFDSQKHGFPQLFSAPNVKINGMKVISIGFMLCFICSADNFNISFCSSIILLWSFSFRILICSCFVSSFILFMSSCLVNIL